MELTNLTDIYIERCDKESENLLKEESAEFLDQPIEYLAKNKNEFIYIEANEFDRLGVSGLSLEVDDVFGTYSVLLGLKLKKKVGPAIKSYLENNLHGTEGKYSLMFNQDDGLWDLNFALSYVEGFNNQSSIKDSCQLLCTFLNNMIQSVEVNTEQPL
jgi:hypothetical protein